MLKQNKILTALAVFALINSFSSSSIFAKELGVKLGGYIRTDMYWDTRATTGIRESMLLFLPKNEELNSHGEDINAVPSFYWGSMGSRLNATISSPDFVGASVSGYLEMEFIGQNDAQTNMIRMRHAYADLDWGKSKLLIGQTWNPMLRPETMPSCVSANGGAPVGALARNPQIRFTQNLSTTLSLQATAFTERDMVSPGPSGNSVEYQKNALIPAFNLLFMHKSVDNKFIIGASGKFQTLKPFNFWNEHKAEGTLNTIVANVFMGCVFHRFNVRLNGYYGGNTANMLMTSGYAVTSITEEDNIMKMKYTPFNNLAVVGDLCYTLNKNAKIGVSGGINMNLGTPDDIYGNLHYTSWNVLIDRLIRVAPRLTYQAGKVQFGGEVEYTQASYGKTKELTNDKWQGKWTETTDVNNIRLLFTTTLFF